MNSTPNVLVIMYDQLTPAVLGCYGSRSRSPRTSIGWPPSGVVFDAAYSNSPLCTPARYCMMTGQLPSATRGYDNAAYLASTIPTFAHYLRAAGYRTVLAGKMHFVGPDQLHGFEERRTTDIYPADFGWTPDWGAARRAYRLVVPQHGQRRRRRRRRGDQPAPLRRRGRLPRRARVARSAPAPTTSARCCSSPLHPSARSLRDAAGVLGPLRRRRDPAAGRAAAASPHDPHSRACARRATMDRTEITETTSAPPVAPTWQRLATSTTGRAG